MSKTIKLAEFIFARLKQLGISAVHGVPGDYNLTLLDYVEPSGLQWIGNANELNAGYATDGYARIKGLGALITTFGVGELSAINAIACAFAERAAVVHIVGIPPRESEEKRLMIHHTLGDGEYRHFAQMASHVTVAQAKLDDSRTATEQFDAALIQCILHSRPVYIEIPVDMVAVPVLAAKLDTQISLPEVSLGSIQKETLRLVVERMHNATQPIILVDCETRALKIGEEVQKLVELTKWPTFTTSSGKSQIDMSLPNVFGIYRGKFATPETKDFVDKADLVLCFGPHFSSTNSFNWSSVPKKDVSILFGWNGIEISNDIYRNIPAKLAISQLLKDLAVDKLKPYVDLPNLPRETLLSSAVVSDSETVKHDKLWRILANFIRPGDIIFGETGTAGYGAREMALPRYAKLFTPITWLSIGYMLPATQGAALAQRELVASSNYNDITDARTILLIGDGSFQMTLQELATIVRLNLNVIVFLVNNDGYTIERCIHGKHQAYNNVAAIRYLEAPSFFGAPKDAYTDTIRTYGDLKRVLQDQRLCDGEGLRMVEVFMELLDAPEGPLMDLLQKQNSIKELETTQNGHKN